MKKGLIEWPQNFKITRQEMKIGLIQYLQDFCHFKILLFQEKIVFILNYNWVLGLPKQAGAELGQAQLELSSLTQLEEISAAIS